MSDLDYNKLLQRVSKITSTKIVDEERFKVPNVDIFYEGNTTVFKNFDKIVDILNRDATHLLKFFLGNVGTAGEIVGGRIVFQGKIPTRTIQDKLNEYVDTFVICSECNRPDTHLVKKGRTILIRCDACGAFRSIKSILKKPVKTLHETLKEGNVYELTIKDIGKRGDGVAFFDKYVVYIPGAVKGSIIKVKIQKISGTVAFGKIEEQD